MITMRDINNKLIWRLRARKAKERGFLVYKNSVDINDVEIQLLEKQMFRYGSVFVEKVKDKTYQAHYTKWNEDRSRAKTKIMYEGTYEKSFKKAVQFCNWLESKNKKE
jgi:hypothetical protein